MRDFWVDGHFITAPDERGARAEVVRLYGYEPEEVRLWEEPEEDNDDEVAVDLAEYESGMYMADERW